MKDIFPYYSIGHFINQPRNRTEFEITRFEEMEEPDVEDFHKHTFYEIIWVEKGKSKQIIDYKEYEIKPGCLFFISPGQMHHFEEWKPITGGTIMFTEDFFLLNQNNKDLLFELSFLDNFYANACVQLDKVSCLEISHTIHLMYTESKRVDPSLLICQSLLQILLAQVQRVVNKQKPITFPKQYIIQYKEFKVLLDEHFTKNITTEIYAKKLNITQHHLNHIIKQVTGKTATEVIRERSMLEAKRLLTFTGETVSEIAARLNYFDSSYFSKVFKSSTGITPVEFKKSISEKYRSK